MKPLLLGRKDPVELQKRDLARYDLARYACLAAKRLGEVVPCCPVDRDCPLYLAAIAPLERSGFFPRKERWGLPDFTAVAGSVGSHEDGGLGLVLSWIVHAKPLGSLGYGADDCDAEILTPCGGLLLTLGDIFVFNADQAHAWLSNYSCVLLQVAVGRRRRRRVMLQGFNGAADGNS